MNVVSLDLSLCATGYATSTGMHGVLTPPKGWGGYTRVKWILDNVWNLCEHSDLVAIEGYAFGAQGRAVFDIAELGGVVRFTLFEAGQTVVEIPPANVKLFATGKGNAKKDEMLGEAIRKLKYNGNNHNVADALWILEMTKARYDKVDVSETKKRALEKVVWPKIAA